MLLLEHETFTIKPMKKICLILHLHQPVLLSKFRFFEIGSSGSYFNLETSRAKIQQATIKKFAPVNRQLLSLFNQYPVEFKISFSFSGTTLDLLEICCPNTLKDLKKINDFGNVEFLGETYSHSFLNQKTEHEFIYQASKQKNKVLNLFGQYPRSFLTTCDYSLDYLNEVLPFLDYDLVVNSNPPGFSENISPESLYQIHDRDGIYLLFTKHHFQGSKEILESRESGKKIYKTAQDFINWMNSLSDENAIVTLLFDYKCLFEELEATKTILDFILELPEKALENNIGFVTPLEVVLSKDFSPNTITLPSEKMARKTPLDCNELQNEILEILDSLKDKVYQTKDENIIKTWYYLQDDFNLDEMSIDEKTVGSLKDDRNPFTAYINYRNILDDFAQKIDDILLNLQKQKQSKNYTEIIRAQRNRIKEQHRI